MPVILIRRTTKSSISGQEIVVVARSKTSLTGKRCLVLDDEFLIALGIQQTLEAAGAAKVVCVSEAADALVAIRNGPRFDLAVLDVVLSGATRTSVMVAAALTAQKTPFVFLTGMRGEGVHTRQFPKAPVLDKPYQPPLLLDAVLRALAVR
jgi:two-component system, response regulator PdtaR